MKSLTKELWMQVPERRAIVSIHDEVERLVAESGVQDGIVLVNAMHITASVFINDNESGLHRDYDKWLEELAPFDPSPERYHHNRTGEDNADAHHKRQVMGREVVVAITDGRLHLGPWEHIFYYEFDGRRRKRILVKIIGEQDTRSCGTMSKQYIFTIADLTKKHGQREVLANIWLAFYPGAKIGVLGRNGSGKSTLLRIMVGEDTEFDGEARLTDGFTRGFLPQEPRLDPDKDVWGNVEQAVAPGRALLDRYNEISVALGEPMDDRQMQKLCDEMARLQDQIDASNTWELDREIEIAFDVMNLPPRDADVSTLSGGERRRVALCKLLLQRPDLLLLDEPTNHLDAEAVAWLERHLAEYAGTVVAVTHDRYFLDNVAGWILELDRGRGIPWEGNYSSWLEQKQVRLAKEEKSNLARQKTLQRELDWVRLAPRARQAKSKARIKAYEQMAAQGFEEQPDEFEIQIPPGQHLGNLVIETENLVKGYGDQVLIDDLSFHLPAGGIVGVIGPNGAGKTTLFRMITGEEEPDAGDLRVGPTVELGYVDQNRDALQADKTVFQEISGEHETLLMGGRKINARAYVTRFNFRGPDQEKKVGDLSGGERNRVHLAKLLRRGSNVLLLDEPTNDLDIDTLRALEEAILNYAGCVVVISHDRWFLDRIATHILAFEGDSYVHWCEGNFRTYDDQRRERLGIAANQPQRFRYKRLKT